MSAPTTELRGGWRKVGLVAAACVACCAGPVLVLIGGVGAAGSLAAWLLWPVAGVTVAAMTVAAVVVVRHAKHSRRRAGEGSAPAQSVV